MMGLFNYAKKKVSEYKEDKAYLDTVRKEVYEKKRKDKLARRASEIRNYKETSAKRKASFKGTIKTLGAGAKAGMNVLGNMEGMNMSYDDKKKKGKGKKPKNPFMM
jgi:hypothetical protein